MSNDEDHVTISPKFSEILALFDAMTDEEVMEFSKKFDLHMALRFQD